MESKINDLDRNICSALAKYESRFIMPENLIVDTMAGIIRQKERKAYIRGLITASIASFMMLACAALMFIYFPVTMPSPDLSFGKTMTETLSTVADIFSNPLIITLAGASAVLLTLDHLLRQRLATRLSRDAGNQIHSDSSSMV